MAIGIGISTVTMQYLGELPPELYENFITSDGENFITFDGQNFTVEGE